MATHEILLGLDDGELLLQMLRLIWTLVIIDGQIEIVALETGVIVRVDQLGHAFGLFDELLDGGNRLNIVDIKLYEASIEDSIVEDVEELQVQDKYEYDQESVLTYPELFVASHGGQRSGRETDDKTCLRLELLVNDDIVGLIDKDAGQRVTFDTGLIAGYVPGKGLATTFNEGLEFT